MVLLCANKINRAPREAMAAACVEGLRDLAHARLRDLAQVVCEERGVRALHQAVDRGVGGVIGGVRVQYS